MDNQKAILALEDGTVFWGQSCGYLKDIAAELVFNTGTTGYQEIITDPSYNRQIVVFTYPHIGNVGTNDYDNESNDFGVSGIVVKHIENGPSNWRNTLSLPDFLTKKKIPGICGIDTRKLTKILRDKGVCRACLMTSSLDPSIAIMKARAFQPSQSLELTNKIKVLNSVPNFKSIEHFIPISNYKSNSHIIVYDFGTKRSILRQIEQYGATITIISEANSTSKIIDLNPDGVIISNGPGDPRLYKTEIENVKNLINTEIPLLGICLGAQLLALAMGAKVSKLKFGHHGINHPVLDIDKNKVYIASQNHNYVVEEKNIPENMKITHRSLFDGTIQGFKTNDERIYGFQGHPEGGPGPSDLHLLFLNFLKLCDARTVK